jgi:acyl dehydratase
MKLDASIVGQADETVAVTVDPLKVAAFAKAIGERRDIYLDSTAARADGHRDIPLPPTYHFSLGRERSRSLGLLEDRGVNLLQLLHGEQIFRYGPLACAGDTLTVARRVSDYFEKKGGALKFIVVETDIRNAGGAVVSLGHETLVLPDAAPPAAPARPVQPAFAVVTGGTCLGPLSPGPITRDMLARFGTASGDFNRVHLDPAAARSAGYDDVFAHGMLSMAWLGRLLTDDVRQDRIREFNVRFLALTPIDAVPVCRGLLSADSRSAALETRLQDGRVTLTGTATFA